MIYILLALSTASYQQVKPLAKINQEFNP